MEFSKGVFSFKALMVIVVDDDYSMAIRGYSCKAVREQFYNIHALIGITEGN